MREKHPRELAEELESRIAAPYDGGKPAAEITRERDFGKSTSQRRVKLVHKTGPPARRTTERLGSRGHPGSSARTRGCEWGG